MDLLNGFATVLLPLNLLFAALGVTIGTLVGVLPGIGPALTIALLLPITFNFDDPIGAFIMFAGIYYGAMYGGSTTSILLNTPGESASVATAIEGHEMAKRGRARAALATAAIGSFVAGVISTLLLAFVAKPIGELAVKFQAADYFALAVLAMVSVTALLGASLVRGLISLVLGLFLGLVGLDGVSGQLRFTFGAPILAEGIGITIVIVGLFAIGEVLYQASRVRNGSDVIAPLEKARLRTGYLSREDWKRSWKPWLRGAAIEGVAGPEAANNASFSGVLVPLLTLGLPTSATAAVMLAAFQIFNLQPGPQLFQTSSDLVWALIASLFVGKVLLFVLRYGFPIAPVILGVILGPMTETQLRRALVISDGSFTAILARPLTLVILLLAVVSLVLPYVRKGKKLAFADED